MKIDNEKRREFHYRIYQTMREDPFLPRTVISKRIGISRNSVGIYLPVMRKKQILAGPRLQLKPSSTHPRYVYLTSFSSPGKTFDLFKRFPHILYHAQCLGDWNLLFVTDTLLDFSKLVGYSETIYRGRRGTTWDLPAQLISWDDAASKIDNWLENPRQVDIPHTEPVEIPWTQDEWKLYWAFRNNTRLKITPTVKKIGIRYRTFSEWRKSLNLYTQTFVEYYPQGLPFSKAFFFLLETDQPKFVSSVFEYWPATTVMTQVDSRLLIRVAFPGGEFPSKVIDLLDRLIKNGYVTSYTFASLFQHLEHKYTEI